MASSVFKTNRITTHEIYRCYVFDKWWLPLNESIKQKLIDKHDYLNYKGDIDKISTLDVLLIYKRERIKLLINYKQFKKILGDSHKEIVKMCLEGGVYNFGSNLGTWQIVKYTRSVYLDDEGKLKGTKPDYGATRKAKAAGNDVVIYHTQSLICKWHWSRQWKKNEGEGNGYSPCIENIDAWSIIPTDGPIGISRKLHHYVEDNVRASSKYREIKITRKDKHYEDDK